MCARARIWHSGLLTVKLKLAICTDVCVVVWDKILLLPGNACPRTTDHAVEAIEKCDVELTEDPDHSPHLSYFDSLDFRSSIQPL